MAKRTTTTGKSRKATRSKTAKPKAAAKPKVAPAPTPAPKPKHSAASLARRKATLISALKSPACTNAVEIRAELEREPMASTPIYSPGELARLPD